MTNFSTKTDEFLKEEDIENTLRKLAEIIYDSYVENMKEGRLINFDHIKKN